MSLGTMIEIPVDGQRADLGLDQLPPTAARKLRNWLLRDGRFIVRPGYTDFADDVDERPMAYIRYKHNNGVVKLVMGTKVGWRVYNSGTNQWDDITDSGDPLTGSNTNHIIFRVMDMSGVTTLLGTNGNDTIKKWNGTDANYDELGGTPPKAVAMEVLFDRLMLGNLKSGSTISPYAVDVSANADPESGFGSTNVTLLADTPGEIVVINAIGNRLGAIYKTDAIYWATAQGDLYPFNYDLFKKDIKGPASERLLVPLEDGLHWWLAGDYQIYQNDTVSVSPLPSHIQAHIRKTIAPNQFSKAWGFCDRKRRDVWFFYPPINSDECLYGVVIDRDTFSLWPIRLTNISACAGADTTIHSAITIGMLSDITIGDLTGTLGEFATDVPYNIVGDPGGQTYKEGGATDDGDGIYCEFESGEILLTDGEDPRRYKEVDEVECLFTPTAGSQEFNVGLQTTDFGEEPAEQQSDTVDIQSAGPFKAEFRLSARKVAMSLTGTAAYSDIEFKGALVSGHLGGMR